VRDRPSRHGKILGEALAVIAAAGRTAAPEVLPDLCATCAFREGCMSNQMASTGVMALNCVLGIDPAQFACHHGMKEGNPTKLCVGYLASLLAPFEVTKAVLLELTKRLDAQGGPDDVRAAFDAWFAEVDPAGEMDVYKVARLFSRSPLAAPKGGAAC
jgi:hypothetical protein